MILPIKMLYRSIKRSSKKNYNKVFQLLSQMMMKSIINNLIRHPRYQDYPCKNMKKIIMVILSNHYYSQKYQLSQNCLLITFTKIQLNSKNQESFGSKQPNMKNLFQKQHVLAKRLLLFLKLRIPTLYVELLNSSFYN